MAGKARKNEYPIIKVGNSTINTESLSSMTMQEFIDSHKGKVSFDLKTEAKKLKKYFKK